MPVPGTEVENASERPRLRLRESVDPAEMLAQEKVKPRVGHRALVLDARSTQHPHIGGRVLRDPQQSRLADPGLAPYDQDAATAATSVLKKALDLRLLLVTPIQPHIGNPTQPTRTRAPR
ncbi:hypothetical protein GCM10010411_48980 [Actinomadura fulvescens]|uniref:Uncharacterized protein n=1 Tax=Actinomadura fulvescens TaxID=46160 RepID=A0ABN3Q2F6_9ACTN